MRAFLYAHRAKVLGKAELDMGPFLLTQSNPIHKVAWKSLPNPIQYKIAGIKANS